MKKITIILTLIILGLISGCSEPQNLNCGTHNNGDSWKEDCNTCTCDNGNILCTEIACKAKPEKNISQMNDLQEQLNEWKFNSNLTDYEQAWLETLKTQHPNTRIILIKSDDINCQGCYDLYFKKDREIIKIVVREGKLKQQSTITNDLVPLIKTPEVCQVFSGKWNDCPAPCSTDEEACKTTCNPPICEFDDSKIVYKKEGEECGGLDKGDCVFGLTCYYTNENDTYGICQ